MKTTEDIILRDTTPKAESRIKYVRNSPMYKYMFSFSPLFDGSTFQRSARDSVVQSIQIRKTSVWTNNDDRWNQALNLTSVSLSTYSYALVFFPSQGRDRSRKKFGRVLMNTRRSVKNFGSHRRCVLRMLGGLQMWIKFGILVCFLFVLFSYIRKQLPALWCSCS